MKPYSKLLRLGGVGLAALFVHTWNYDQAAERRAYLDRLAAKIQALPREAIRRVYLPLTRR
jgi:hypothetical protein